MSVTVFQTISGAQQILKDHTPDLLLVDWNMPDGQGDVFCQWIRSQWEFLPLIFLTVQGDSRDIVLGFQYGADDYVVKPFELEILYSRILSRLFGIEGGLAGNGLKVRKKAYRTSTLSLTLSFLAFTIILCFFTLSGISTNHTYFERYQDAWDVMVTM